MKYLLIILTALSFNSHAVQEVKVDTVDCYMLQNEMDQKNYKLMPVNFGIRTYRNELKTVILDCGFRRVTIYDNQEFDELIAQRDRDREIERQRVRQRMQSLGL